MSTVELRSEKVHLNYPNLSLRILWMLNDLDLQKRLKGKQLVERTYTWTRDCYRAQRAMKKFQLKGYSTEKERIKIYLDWIEIFL